MQIIFLLLLASTYQSAEGAVSLKVVRQHAEAIGGSIRLLDSDSGRSRISLDLADQVIGYDITHDEVCAVSKRDAPRPVVDDSAYSDLRRQLSKADLRICNLDVCGAPDVNLLISKLNLQNVEILNVGFSEINSESIARIAGLPNLRQLVLSGTSISDADLLVIGGSESVETICLDGCTNISEAGIISLLRNEHLTTIFVRGFNIDCGKIVASTGTDRVKLIIDTNTFGVRVY